MEYTAVSLRLFASVPLITRIAVILLSFMVRMFSDFTTPAEYTSLRCATSTDMACAVMPFIPPSSNFFLSRFICVFAIDLSSVK